jgi:hypothetical protein
MSSSICNFIRGVIVKVVIYISAVLLFLKNTFFLYRIVRAYFKNKDCGEKLLEKIPNHVAILGVENVENASSFCKYLQSKNVKFVSVVTKCGDVYLLDDASGLRKLIYKNYDVSVPLRAREFSEAVPRVDLCLIWRSSFLNSLFTSSFDTVILPENVNVHFLSYSELIPLFSNTLYGLKVALWRYNTTKQRYGT